MNTDKKLDWCLKKGETEKRKHRGLRKVEPSIDQSKKHIQKAEHNIKFLERVRDLKDFNDWIFPIAFYSIYHACLAILAHFGYESRNQECTFTVLEKLIEDGKINLSKDEIEFIRKLGEGTEEDTIKFLREEFQYGTDVEAEEDLVNDAVATTKDFVNKVKGLLYTMFGEV